MYSEDLQCVATAFETDNKLVFAINRCRNKNQIEPAKSILERFRRILCEDLNEFLQLKKKMLPEACE